MAKLPSVLAAMVVLAIAVVLFGTPLFVQANGDEGRAEEGSPIPFVTILASFLSFVAGYALRDALGLRAQRAARRAHAEGRRGP